MNVFNSSFAEITIFPFLKFKQNLGLNHSNSRRNTYYNRHTQEGKAPINGYGGQADSWWTGVTTESILTFDKRFKQIHSVNAMGGFTYEKANYGYKSMTATNFPNDITGEMDMSQGLNPGPLSSGRGDNTLVFFLARVNYRDRKSVV